ncbi:MAG: multidrug transporter ATP-binding protein, partial [Acidimicrobiaceae bacterium]|nr:multidrug transporter ATP-binding protein [Acidimicrobiaceae bacterium]
MVAREVETTQSILEFRDLYVRYDESTAIQGISFCVVRGQWLGLIGANGAGKTSLLKALARL